MGYIKFKTTCNDCKAVTYFYCTFDHCLKCGGKDIKYENIRKLNIDLWSDEGKLLTQKGIDGIIKIDKEGK